METRNVRRESRSKAHDETPERQFKSFDNTRNDRRVAKINKEATRIQDELSEELKNDRKERKSAINNIREKRRRSRERHLETFDIKRNNR